jgi:hypothetical protein
MFTISSGSYLSNCVNHLPNSAPQILEVLYIVCMADILPHMSCYSALVLTLVQISCVVDV